MNLIRVSENYHPPDMIRSQNLIWPQIPSYDNPIVAVLHKDRYCRFNFILESGDGTNIDPGDI